MTLNKFKVKTYTSVNKNNEINITLESDLEEALI